MIRRFAAVPILALALTAQVLAMSPQTPARAVPANSAFAVIGTITTPVTVDTLAIDGTDDTLYATGYGARKLLTITRGATSGTPVANVSLPGPPAGMAVDADDDTVYIFSGWPGRDLWVSDAGRSLAGTIPIGYTVNGLAVDSADDTVFASIGYYLGDDSLAIINGRSPDDSVWTSGGGWNIYGMGVTDTTDTVWLAGFSSDTMRTLDGATAQITSIPGTYLAPRDLAASPTVSESYVSTTIGSGPGLQKVATTGSLGTWTDPAAEGLLLGVSVNAASTRAVFYTGNGNETLWIVDTVSMTTEGSLTIPAMNDTIQAASGLIYVAPYTGNSIYVVAEIQASLSASSASPGDTLTISVTPLPGTAAGQPVTVDDSTLPSVDFGGVTVPATRVGVNTFEITVPAGVTGVTPVVANLAGGSTLALGDVTLPGGSTPATTPASAPLNVAVDTAAKVSWQAPATQGSFPVSNYQAVATPGGRDCLVDARETTCTLDGLTPGESYEIRVRALTGAGWGAWSDPVSVVPAPAASIVIAGSRTGRSVLVEGASTGLVGQQVTPGVRFPGGGGYTPGRSVRRVDTSGEFTWQRVTGKKIYVYFQATLSHPDGSVTQVRSNRVIIPAR